MTPESAVLITLVSYKALLVLIGVWAERRTRDGLDFFLGGRRVGPVVTAISASASSSSAWTLLGVSGAAYAWGLSALWLFPACAGGFALNWYVVARPLRAYSHREGAVTLVDVIAGPPGGRLRGAVVVLAAAVILISLAGYVAAQFDGAGKALADTFGVPRTESILIGAAIVLFYTLLGGYWGVSVTDTLQGLVMALACVLLPAVALVEVGGPAGLFRSLAVLEGNGYLGLAREGYAAGAVGFVLGTLGIGLGYPGQPHVVNRYMAMREGERELRRGRRIALAWAAIVYAGMLVLGWSGRVLFPGMDDSERVLVRAANELVHPVVAGVLLAAVLSAIMSTADSQLLVAASTITYDLGFGGKTTGAMLIRSRRVVFALSAAAVAAALLVETAIFHRVLFAWTAMGAAFGPLLLVTLLRGPVAPGRSLLAIASGFGLSACFHMMDGTRGGIFERVLPFTVALAIALVSGRRRRGRA